MAENKQIKKSNYLFLLNNTHQGAVMGYQSIKGRWKNDGKETEHIGNLHVDSSEIIPEGDINLASSLK